MAQASAVAHRCYGDNLSTCDNMPLDVRGKQPPPDGGDSGCQLLANLIKYFHQSIDPNVHWLLKAPVSFKNLSLFRQLRINIRQIGKTYKRFVNRLCLPRCKHSPILLLNQCVTKL
ncbi:MAG: hypothetical protein R3C26_14300 [Calditrichia bacterium]